MIVNTLNITLLSLCTFPCSIIFALFLNEVTQTKFKKFAQMISYMPHFLSEVVVVSLVLLLLDLNNGPINNMIEAFGGERYYFMGDPDIFPTIYVLQSLWQGLPRNRSRLPVSTVQAASRSCGTSTCRPFCPPS